MAYSDAFSHGTQTLFEEHGSPVSGTFPLHSLFNACIRVLLGFLGEKKFSKNPEFPEDKSMFFKSGKFKKAVHLWDGSDTFCRMHSTGGLASRHYTVSPTSEGRHICSLCRQREILLETRTTGPAMVTPGCDCDVLPWDDCMHTDAAAHAAMLEQLGMAE